MDFIYTVIFVDKFDTITYHKLSSSSMKALKRLNTRVKQGKLISVEVNSNSPQL